MENMYNNANVNSETTKENNKNNVYLNLKTKTKKGEIRHFSMILMVAGSGLAQSNGKILIEKALQKAETKGLEEANKYLKEVLIDAVVESDLSISGVRKASSDWADDY